MLPRPCAFCGQGNPDTAKFCNECGSPLHLKPCDACLGINDLAAETCHQCGARFAQPLDESAVAPPPSDAVVLPVAVGPDEPLSRDPPRIRAEFAASALLLLLVVGILTFHEADRRSGASSKPPLVEQAPDMLAGEGAATRSTTAAHQAAVVEPQAPAANDAAGEAADPSPSSSTIPDSESATRPRLATKQTLEADEWAHVPELRSREARRIPDAARAAEARATVGPGAKPTAAAASSARNATPRLREPDGSRARNDSVSRLRAEQPATLRDSYALPARVEPVPRSRDEYAPPREYVAPRVARDRDHAWTERDYNPAARWPDAPRRYDSQPERSLSQPCPDGTLWVGSCDIRTLPKGN